MFFASYGTRVNVLSSSKWRHRVMRFHAVREGVARLEVGAVVPRVYAWSDRVRAAQLLLRRRAA